MCRVGNLKKMAGSMYKHILFPLILASTFGIASETPTPPADTSQMPLVPRYNNNVFLDADFLYWYSKQEGNNYAATGSAITVPGTTDPNTGLIPSAITTKGKVYSPSPKAEPGFRVAIGINLDYDRWELYTNYTYAHGKASGSIQSDNLNTGILPIFSYTPNNSILASATYATTGGATGFVSEAVSGWCLYFNNINLELARAFMPSRTFTLRPHLGLQGAWQIQHFHTTYTVSSFTSPETDLGGNFVHFEQHFWGVGPRAGLDGNLQCCKHLGIFGETSVSALWSNFKSDAKSYDTNGIAGYSGVLISHQVNKLNSLSPVIQLQLGFQSDWDLYNRYQIVLHAGWEAQVWFFQNQHSSTIADTSLILQGLTFGIKFTF